MKLVPIVAALALAAPASAQWNSNGYKVWTFQPVGVGTGDADGTLRVHAHSHFYPAVRATNTFGGTVVTAIAVGNTSSALEGINEATFGHNANGVYGTSLSNEGTGVRGVAYSDNGPSRGVYGRAESQVGMGVEGEATSTYGINYGVRGRTSSGQGYSGHFTGGKFYVGGSFAGINRDSAFNSSEVFGVHKETSGYGGMYVSTSGNGKPFYGYSADGSNRAWSYYDGPSSQWRLHVGTDRLTVDRVTGNVGIGTTTPQYRLHVAGDAAKPGGGSWTITSDRRLKKDITPVDDALERLLALRGVTYEYIDHEAIDELPGRQTGVIAQEVEEVFPEWVDEGADGYKRVTFRGFEALTVEAMRDLRTENDALRATNDELRGSLDELRRTVELLGARLDAQDEARR